MELFEHTADLARNVAVGTNGRKQLAALYTGVDCLALPMDARRAVDNGYSVGKAWDVFFAVDQDVKVGDQITVLGRALIVQGVQPFAVPDVGHTRVAAVEGNV